MNPVDAQLMSEIKDFLEKTGMKPSTFGRDMVGDPSFISDVEGGRSPSGKLATRIRDKMAKYLKQQRGRKATA